MDINLLKLYSLLFAFSLVLNVAFGQDRCGTVLTLEQKFISQPTLKVQYETLNSELNSISQLRKAIGVTNRVASDITIPVVFHVVLADRVVVTDQQIIAQLDTINKDFNGTNSGQLKILEAFKARVGIANIKFCLAQRDANGQSTSGIVRYSTTVSSFTYTSEDVKHASRKGADAWDTKKYLNIWICGLNNSILGYSSFPGIGNANEDGVVIDYSSLPGGNTTNYSQGKTLTHEIGHYFSLKHIWGDDNGACSGSDDIEDTPNQGNSTTSCRTGIVTDNCSSSSPGIMYQNFMDYSPDACLFLFTQGQVARMQDAFARYRSSLLLSDGCNPVSVQKNDASLRVINSPVQRLCSGSFTPQVTLKNNGERDLTSVNIVAKIDDGAEITLKWQGLLPYMQETIVSFNNLSVEVGEHVLKVYTQNPNGVSDENVENDLLTYNFIYFDTFSAPVQEGFEDAFPAAGWDIVNPDGAQTWQRTTTAFKTGRVSAVINNYSYNALGQTDYLRSPTVNIANSDSAFVSFQLAASAYNNFNVIGVVWDTLQVLVSSDCGKTYTSVYKKWGADLITASATTSSFVPKSSDWKRVEVNLGEFINRGEILVAFKNSNGNQNNIYLDDINIRTVVVNPNLKEAGFLVSPNPASEEVKVEFYPHPADLKSITIYNVAGQKMLETNVSSPVSSNAYSFDVRSFAAGLYIVKVERENGITTKKFIKR